MAWTANVSMLAMLATRPELAAPPRPGRLEEALSSRLFLGISPRLAALPAVDPPPSLAPWEILHVARRHARGAVRATWFPAAGAARGAVLLAPPWHARGRAYFHRRGRIEALRAAGYHSLTVDLPNFGGSGPPAGYFDRDLGAAADALERRCPGLPLHFWGVSSGGYWGHPLLAAEARFAGAMFEDVSPHLLEWAWRLAPRGRPCYLLFRMLFRRGYRFLDARRQAAASRAARTAYAAGGADPGIPAADSVELARRAGGELVLVPGAGHLEAIKRAGPAVLDLALATFAAAGGIANRRSRR